MQTSRVAVAMLLADFAGAASARSDPLGTVFEMLDELKVKIIKDGEREAKAYKEFFDWCDDTANSKGNEITSGKARKADLEATIAQSTSDADASAEKVEQLAASISADSKELKDAVDVREKEASEFASNEAELVDTVDTLGRAIGTLEKEMSKNPAAFAQIDTSDVNKMTSALRAIVDAAAFRADDKQKLLALVQSQQRSADDDDEQNAPAAANYKTHSGGIFDVLEDLKEDAEEQLSNLRKAESTSAHNFAMLKQSLEDSISADTHASDEEKAAREASVEKRATAEGDLALTVKDLKAATDSRELARTTCLQKAADHEKTVTGRTEELSVLDQAKKILKDSTSGAASQTYSMLQFGAQARLLTRDDLAHAEVVTKIETLARDHHSSALAQLASRISAAMKYSAASGTDPFGKVRNLIQDLINKLQQEAAAEATEKGYCDEQLSKTEAKKAELEEDTAKLTTKIDEASARSAQLKGEVQQLGAELAALAKSQADMDSVRSETHADYVQAKSDLEAGLAGVRKALEVLRDYYGSSASAALLQQPAAPELHGKSTGAGGSIVNILEVCESDFASGLAKEEMEESNAEAEYQKITQENSVTKLMKDQDQKYKTHEFTVLDKKISDMSSDLASENSELSAVLQYYAQVKDRCIAVPESYEERAAKRQAEISGLKEALSVLENETALTQRKKRAFRGHHLGM